MTTPQASAPQPPADRSAPGLPPTLADPAARTDAPSRAETRTETRTETRGAHPVRVACGTEIGLRLVTGPGDEIPFPARLTYTQADPYAVRLHCQTGSTTSVTWVLSRDTLRHGLDRPSGLGDVHVRPAPGHAADGQGGVLITLGSGREAALLRGDASELQRFLHLSAAIVPLGAEHQYLDVDALVSRLLTTP